MRPDVIFISIIAQPSAFISGRLMYSKLGQVQVSVRLGWSYFSSGITAPIHSWRQRKRQKHGQYQSMVIHHLFHRPFYFYVHELSAISIYLSIYLWLNNKYHIVMKMLLFDDLWSLTSFRQNFQAINIQMLLNLNIH